MNFNDKLISLFTTRDFDGALSLIHAACAEPVNQKPKSRPSDFLYSETGQLSLGDRFEHMLTNFRCNCGIDENLDFLVSMLNASRNGASDNDSIFQPFNSLVFDIGYSTIATSFHYDPRTNTVLRQYGLNHEALGEHQMDNFYDPELIDGVRAFMHDLENGKYAIRYGDEILDGRMLSGMTNRILIARFLRDVFIPALIAHEGFAEFPKALPFRFILTAKPGSAYEERVASGDFIELHPPIEPEGIGRSALGEVYAKSTLRPTAAYPDDHLLYYVNFLGKDRQKLPGFSRLCDIVVADKSVLGIMRLISEILLKRQMSLCGEYEHPERFLGSQLKAFLRAETGNTSLSSPNAVQNHAPRLADVAISVDGAEILEAADDRDWSLENLEALLLRLQKSEMGMGVDDSGLLCKVFPKLGRFDVDAFLTLFRALGDRDPAYASLAPEYAKRFLGIASPKLGEDPERAIGLASIYLEMVSSTLSTLSVDQQASVLGSYGAKIQELTSHPSAIYRTLAYEAEFARIKKSQADGKNGESQAKANERQESLRSYATAVSELLLLMPDSFNLYTPLWYFVIRRVTALGSSEPSVIPRLLSIFEKYSAPGGYDSERVSAEIGTMLIRAGMREIPAKLESRFRQIMREEKEYQEWKRRIPEEKFKRFITLFESQPEVLRDPSAWEEYIHDTRDGIEFFRDRVESHQQKKAILDFLFKSAAKGPGPRLKKLLETTANGYASLSNRERPFHLIAQDIVACLAPVPDSCLKLLVQARLVTAWRKTLNGESDAGECLAALAPHRNDYPIIAVFEAAREIYASGIDGAIGRFVDRVMEMANKDPIYARDFCSIVGGCPGRPGQAEMARGYAIFSRSFNVYAEWPDIATSTYRESFGKLLADPVKTAVAELSADIRERGGAHILDPLLREYELRKALESSSREELSRLIDSCDEDSSRIIISHLRPRSDSYGAEYMAMLAHFRADATRYKTCVMRLWAIPQIHNRLLDALADYPGLPQLPDFIYRFIGGNDYRITNEIFNHLHATKRHDAVMRMAGGLSTHRLIPYIEVVVNSIVAERKYTEAIGWFLELRKESAVKHPHYVFLTNRIAVFQALSGDADGASRTYADLFALDWGAFTGGRSDSDILSDDILAEIMGGSLDRELIDQFNLSFASAHYNMACLMARNGNAAGAVDELKSAVSFNPKGYPASAIRKDQDFKGIRESDVFRAFMEKLTARG